MKLMNALLDNTEVYKDFPWVENIVDVLNNIIAPILIVIGAVGVIYAIYLGVMLAKAENAEKREEAKKRIINVVVAIAITAVLIFLMYLFSNNLDWFISTAEDASKTTPTQTQTQTNGDSGNTSQVIGLLKMFFMR